ncbi:MAG: phosphatase PAP2 family protein [Gemmatimonadales bacterium]
MRRWAVVCTMLLSASAPAAAQAPYRATWWEAASVTVAGTLTVLPLALDLPHGPPSCAPCDPASLPGIDRAALHTFSRPAGTASHVLLAGVVGGAGVALLRGRPSAEARGNAAVLANSVVWSAAATQWLKVLVGRHRPVLYTANAAAAALRADNQRSFPSGHAAAAFATATSYVVIARRERLPHRARNAILLYGGAVSVSTLRVVAGKHFPTDVAGGALLGSGVGWLVARVHPTQGR